MSISNSVLKELLQALPSLRSQMYFKSSLTALSHAMEDRVLAGIGEPLVIASFQRERFYKQEAHRYKRIAKISNQVYVLSAPETDFKNHSEDYETIAFAPQDELSKEWHLIVISEDYAYCLVCREKTESKNKYLADLNLDNNRRFEGIWTFDRQTSKKAASILLEKIVNYRPELLEKIDQASNKYLKEETEEIEEIEELKSGELKSEELKLVKQKKDKQDPFVERLVAYLQAGQYKFLKANRTLAAKEKKERLLNSITTTIRQSLDPQEILQLSVQKLGQGVGVCRCIVYRCNETDTQVKIKHEFINEGVKSIRGEIWPLNSNPLFRQIVRSKEAIKIDEVNSDPRIQSEENRLLQDLVETGKISSWLLVPLLYQGKLLGMVELHHCQENPIDWLPEDISLVDSIATQIAVALIQAEAYVNLEDLNQQLEALDRTRSNLVAIVGHELRTPLSTIQVCLESLSSEPDMSEDLQQVMLQTALTDAERMRTLIQDFLTLSQLESGRFEWNPEPLSISECVDLALSHVKARNLNNELPEIENQVSTELPSIEIDGEWLVEVLTKLLDNACKFTTTDGMVTIEVEKNNSHRLLVTVSDTGRGIEPNRLETVFDRFYQEEGALRRSTGGTGLGLAICRQIVKNWGGEIWAESNGKNQGSKFRFTVPTIAPSINTMARKS